jgi:dTDP-glucose 4,6-dehydratase/UDP-glucose 4-epimerase
MCINCSGSASVPNSFIDPHNDFKLNVINVVLLLEAVRKYNAECKFMNISSAAVYGNPLKLPVSEHDALNPISPYGYHKMFSETILDAYNKLWDIKTCSLRIFSAYGNGLKKQLLFDIAKKMFFDTEIKLYGTGAESRDFIHIDDICYAIDCIAKNCEFNSHKINVANGLQITVMEIAQFFNSICKYNKDIVFDGIERPGDPSNWSADISLLKSYGYQQTVAISDGVKRYIEWAKKEILQ